MRMKARTGPTLLVALALFISVSLGTATVFAVDCISECGGCTNVRLDCDVCGGEGCSDWGIGCDWSCWDCGSGFDCNPITP
jgi:hypothetical protein